MNHLLTKATVVAAAMMVSIGVAAASTQGAAGGAPKAKAQKAVKQERIHLSTDTKVMPVALHQANRIHVEGGRVMKAIANTQVVQLQNEASTGSLYVFPLVAEQFTVYVITESGETHSVTLSPKEKIASQTITIKENVFSPISNYKTVSEKDDFAFDYSPQSVIAEIGTLNLAKGKKFKDTKRTDGTLVAEPASLFTVKGYRLERWILKNPTENPVPIYEGGFYRRGDLAIATLIAELPAKGKTDLWIVKEGV